MNPQLYFHTLKQIFGVVGVVVLSLLGSFPVEAQIQNNTLTSSSQIAQIPATTSLNILDTIVSAGEFTILTQALQAADLVDLLKGDGPFTLFAPTDKAFSALPPETLESLLQPENQEQLIKILTHHVVAGEILSADLKSGELETIAGDQLNIQADSSVKIDNAVVIKADVPARNGVIHVIDSVILRK